ncbi:MAG: hypothetical protein NTZ90_15615 [Proteobacteria bacterium]|nr:hypothetical protein [Pseudomonadota bacterium]
MTSSFLLEARFFRSAATPCPATSRLGRWLDPAFTCSMAVST